MRRDGTAKRQRKRATDGEAGARDPFLDIITQCPLSRLPLPPATSLAAYPSLSASPPSCPYLYLHSRTPPIAAYVVAEWPAAALRIRTRCGVPSPYGQLRHYNTCTNTNTNTICQPMSSSQLVISTTQDK